MRKPSKRRNSGAGLGSPHSPQRENVGIDACDGVVTDTKKPHHNLGKTWKWREAAPGRKLGNRNSFARIPTEPHPDNVAMVSCWPASSLGMPVTEFLRQKLAHLRERANPETSFFAWCGWQAASENLEKRLEGAFRHPEDRPISETTMQLLALALAALKRDLEDNSPF